jgi:RNA polymerase sigma factor (sigma-70 family)
VSLSVNSIGSVQTAATEDRAEQDWLNVRAEEIVRCNPGGAFPEDDREFSERALHLVELNARARVHGQSYSLFNCNDLTQESFVRIIRFFPQFRGTNFRAWTYNIVKNTFLSLIKVDRNGSATSIEEIASRRTEEASPAEYLLVSQIDIGEEMDTARLLDDFLKWLCERNPKHARIVDLNLYGLKDEEIADSVGAAYRTVCSVLQRTPRDYQKFLIRVQKEKLRKARRTAG